MAEEQTVQRMQEHIDFLREELADAARQLAEVTAERDELKTRVEKDHDHEECISSMTADFHEASEQVLLRAEQAERERDLFKKKAHDWNSEADRYLAQRDEAQLQLAALRVALEQVTAQLRHAYSQLVTGCVQNSLIFADGLIAPQIRKLESLLTAPPQEPT